MASRVTNSAKLDEALSTVLEGLKSHLVKRKAALFHFSKGKDTLASFNKMAVLLAK